LGGADDSDARQRKHYHVRQEKTVILIFVADSLVIRFRNDNQTWRAVARFALALAAAVAEKPTGRS